MQKKIFAVVFFSFCLCLVAFAQGDQKGKDNSGGGSSANSGSAANAQVTVNQGSGGSRQFVQALPGVVGAPGPFPGFAMNHGDWHLYRPLSTFPIQDLGEAKNNKGVRKINSTVLAKIEENSDPIHLINWWPEDAGYKEDQVLGEFTVVGKSSTPRLQVIAFALAEAKRQTNTRRCAVHYRAVAVGVTKGFSIGSSGASSQVRDPEASDAWAAAVGGIIGKNSVRKEELPEVDAICLNDGSNEAPEEKAEAPAPAPVPQPAAAPAIAPAVAQAPPPQPPPPPPTQLSAVVDEIPEFTILFDFDRSDVKPSYNAKIKEFGDWLTQHPSYHLQIEGHTCTIGSGNYNAALGRRRALAVKKAFQKINGDGVMGQLDQPVSVAYDKPASELKPENRRVILRVIGPATGK